MNITELLTSERAVIILAGVAGAAAMAATDWRSPWRFAQHIFVGTAAAGFATPIFFPIISTALGLARVDVSAHAGASAFITGVFAIYILEFVLAFWKHKISAHLRDKRDD